MRSLNVTWTKNCERREKEREDNEVFVALRSSLPSPGKGVYFQHLDLVSVKGRA